MTRFITKTIHSYLDYPVAAGLIAMPFLFGIGASNTSAFWLSIVTGIAAFFLTILTDHKTGVFPLISYKLHLLVDAAVGVVFVLAPHVLGFSGADLWYYTLLGAMVLSVVGLHKAESEMLATA